ncbi:MAG: DUF3784 domain-containing protein [Bacillota bacterium]|nr:DUF3784 domain-containing protein [Bacillota bacterium]
MTQALFHLSLALFLFLLGGLIKYGKVHWLIAGYNTLSEEEKDKYKIEDFCRGVSYFLFALAGTLLIPAAGGFFNIAWAIHLGWILFALA